MPDVLRIVTFQRNHSTGPPVTRRRERPESQHVTGPSLAPSRAKPDHHEAIVVAIGASLTLLTAAHRDAGFRSRGQAALDVIKMLGTEPLEKVLLAGFLTSAWGPAFHWQTEPPRLVAIVSDDLLRRSTSSGPRDSPSTQQG
jgi:hypothetical protein